MTPLVHSPAMDAPPTAPADLELGSFSDTPEWIVVPDEMPWRARVDDIRWLTQHNLPDLIAPRRLPRGTRVFSVLRHFGTAVGLWYLRARGKENSRADLSRRLRIAAEHLGPTYIKLAQIISSGEGLFPEELVTEFKKCRDQVPAEPFSAVRATIESEFGRTIEDLFSEFDQKPLAAASIAQVHAAALHTG